MKSATIIRGTFVLTLLCAICPCLAQSVGWRTDGTSRYLQADPPTAWTGDVVNGYKTPMADWSNGTPVIVGERIFITAEPNKLLCLQRETGKVVWTQAANYADMLSPEQKTQMQQADEQAKKVSKQLRPFRKQARTFSRRLRKDPNDAEAKAALAELHQQTTELDKQLAALGELRNPPTHRANGYTSATPASDGENVYVVFGSGNGRV